MNCEQVRDLWDQYRDGELSGAQAKGLEDHLADCAGCERVWRRESSWLAVLGDAAPVLTEEESRAFAARVVRAWAKPRQTTSVAGVIGRWVAAAAMVALMLSLAVSQFWNAGEEPGYRELTRVSHGRTKDRVLMAQVHAPVGAAREALRGAAWLMDVDRYADDLADFVDATTGATQPNK